MAKNAIITEVDCSRDLEQAKVYFTTVDPSVRDDVKKALGSVAGLFRSLLGKQLALRQTPALTFHIDASEEYGRTIDILLDSLKTELDHGKDETTGGEGGAPHDGD